MSRLYSALMGYMIGSLFRMPMIGLIIGLFYSPALTSKTRSKQQSWNFNSFIREDYTEGRWVQGCFSTLGAFAKAGNAVTEDDIQFAEALMRRWNYSAAHREQAINAFRFGRQEDPEKILNMLSQSYYWSHTLQGYRLMSLLNAYLQRKPITSRQRALLEQWAAFLGNPQSHSYHRQEQHHQQSSGRTTTQDLTWAYRALDASSQDDMATVKKKFRKLISRTHPDRNPTDPKATEKTQKLQKAYAIIKQAKGWK